MKRFLILIAVCTRLSMRVYIYMYIYIPLSQLFPSTYFPPCRKAPFQVTSLPLQVSARRQSYCYVRARKSGITSGLVEQWEAGVEVGCSENVKHGRAAPGLPLGPPASLTPDQGLVSRFASVGWAFLTWEWGTSACLKGQCVLEGILRTAGY